MRDLNKSRHKFRDKLSFQKVKRFVWGYAASKWQSWIWDVPILFYSPSFLYNSFQCLRIIYSWETKPIPLKPSKSGYLQSILIYNENEIET